MLFNPLFSLIRTIYYFLTRRISFPKELVGTTRIIDGTEYTIFRHCRINRAECKDPKADFIVHFRLASMGIEENIRFSVLPIPFFVGLPGFCSKLWLYQKETGEFVGLYQWKTPEQARRYANSFAMGFMTRRAIPGSVSYKIAG